ncbi:hypothetical protein, partial [Massilia psychrophila]|uniref:hypothetical protein n=1 Tax=Massilia psychrophila TaxID=1603353 RepID=UPI001C557B10
WVDCREDLPTSRESFEAPKARRKTTQEDDSEKLLKCLNLGGLMLDPVAARNTGLASPGILACTLLERVLQRAPAP